MRNKGSKGKSSLQKTASSIINIHTHRNSQYSQAFPFHCHDSLASIRTSSLGHRNCPSVTYKRIENTKRQDKSRKRNKSRQSSKILVGKKSDIKNRDRQLYQLYSEEMSSIGRQISTKLVRTDTKAVHNADFSASLELKPDFQADSQNKLNLLTLLTRTKSLLSSYQNYAHQLELDCKKYKNKYGEICRKLKKYQNR